MKKKKPTIKEVLKVVESLINEVQILQRRQTNLEFINSSYYDWKKEKSKFQKHVNKKLEKLSKDRANDSISNK